jgi:hypothetical protein
MRNEKTTEIEQFIVWDFCSDVTKFYSINIENLLISNAQYNSSKYYKYKYILDFTDRAYNLFQAKLFKIDKKKRTVLFCSIRCPLLVSGIKNEYNTKLFLNGKAERFFALKNLIGYFSLLGSNQLVYNYFNDKKEVHLYRLINRVENALRVIKPNYAVFCTDGAPLERSVILACKNMGIPTLNIQEGIYQDVPIQGNATDYVLVWGKFFKNLYLTKGNRNSHEVYILGYPHKIDTNAKKYDQKKLDLQMCYLGQCFESYKKECLQIKLDTLNKLNKMCINLNMKFSYRPHPGDNVKLLKQSLPKIKFLEKEKLEETFKRGDIFVSFNSTSLIEASMHSKLCIQLRNYPLKAQNFEELGVCNKSVLCLKELNQYLKQIITQNNLALKGSKFNNEYIDIKSDPIKRFVDILKDIECKK